MSDPSLKLPIESTFDPRGTDAALRALQALQQAQAKAQTGSGGGAAPAFQATSSAAQQAERDTLRYASAMAQAQRATGDAAGAVETLRSAHAALTPNTIEAHQATTRLAQAEAAAARETQGLASQFSAGLKSSILGIIGPAALAGGAIAAIGKVGELIQVGAQAEQTRIRFDQLAKQANTTGDAMLGALRRASGGTIKDTALELDAMKASLLGVGNSAQQLGPLLAIARDRAQQMGISTEFAFESLVTGLGRGSRLILDNIGVIVKEGEVNEAYAKSVGKTVAQLTDQEKKQALINEVIRQGNETIAATGGAVESSATKIERLNTTLDNLKEKAGGALLSLGAPFINGANQVAQASDKAAAAGEKIIATAGSYEEYRASLDRTTDSIANIVPGLGQLAELYATHVAGIAPLTEAQYSYARALMAAGTAAPEAIAKAREYTGAVVESGVAIATHTSVTQQNSAAMASRAQLARIAAQADADAATQSLIDTQNKAAQTAQTQLLEAQTQAAAQAFLLLHPNISAAGIASLVAAGQINPLIAQLATATLQAREATAALAQFQMQQGLKAQTGADFQADKIGFQRDLHELRNDALAKEKKAYQDHARDVANAKRDQVLAVGKHNEQIKQREADLAEAERKYGRDSAEYIRAQTALIQEQQQKQRGAGRAGGGARLSDQQKLNNQLLVNQERADNQLEDAEKQHQQKLLDIQAEFERKSLEQQRANEVGKRASRADFYEALTEATKDIGVKEAKQLSAEYEEAYRRSQEMAQAGNQQQADEYLKLKQRQLQEELDYQKRLAEARKNKDSAEVNRLQEVHKLRQDQYAEEQRQLEQQGDKNVNQRDEQIAEENKRYDEQTGHIKEQADRAADAKVDAAKRSGKAVSDENSALERQLDLLNQIKDTAGQIPAPALPGAGGGGEAPPGENAAAGGGTFMTRGPTTLTVGDNPGGVELVQVTPLSGRGTTHVGGGMARMAGGGTLIASGGGLSLSTSGGSSGGGGSDGGVAQAIAILREAADIIVVIAQTVRTNKSLLSLLNQYAQILTNATTVLTNIADLRARLALPQPPLDLALVQQLANEQAAVVAILASSIVPSIFSAAKWLEKYKDGAAAATDILKGLLDLREQISKTQGPIDPAVIQRLAAESAIVAQTVLSALVPLSEQTVEGVKRYTEGGGAAITLLKDMADLTRSLGEPLPPIPVGSFERLANLAGLAVLIVSSRLIPTSQAMTDALKRYQESSGAAIGVLKDMTDLARGVAEPIPPIPMGTFERMAGLAALATLIVTSRLIPQSQQQTEAIKRYQESAGAAVGVIKDTAELGKDLATVPPAVNPAAIGRLADLAAQVTRIVASRMVKTSDEQVAAAKRYAETEGAAVELLKNTLELPAKLFTDYQSPSDAQITRVVRDADRIAHQINNAAKAYDTKGLEAAKAFSEAIGGTFSAFKEGLIFFQALNSGDFVLDPKKLAIFERSMGQTIAVAGRLGKQAAAIPAANITALQNVTAALTATYESLIKLGAVPFGNLPTATGGLGKLGGGSTTITIAPGAIVIQGAGQNANQIADVVLRRLNQLSTARR